MRQHLRKCYSPLVGPSGWQPPETSDDRKKASFDQRKIAKPQYQLLSKAELLYPEAFEPVSADFWHGVSQHQRDQLIRLQAIAMEKVGFEKDAPKFFIDDGAASATDRFGRSVPAEPPRTTSAPLATAAGIVLGVAVMAILLGFLPIYSPEAAGHTTLVLVACGFTALIVGAVMARSAL
jgi:hypothetical protein